LTLPVFLELEDLEFILLLAVVQIDKKQHLKEEKEYHYSSDKIEKKLGRVLNELTRYMYDMNNEIIVSNSIILIIKK
jgi:hypothetical protein